MSPQCTVRTATLVGVRAVPVDVEVDVGAGLPSFSIVGLPDVAVQEARERVRSAIRASGFEVPNARIVINLAPGPLRKHGTGFDLPIACALLAATGQLPRDPIERCLTVGELSLDGSLRSVPGMLAHALAARDAGTPLLGPGTDDDAARVPGVTYLPLRRLAELKAGIPRPARSSSPPALSEIHTADFADVVGQSGAIRALTIAAAGGHNMLMVGPPGSGKTMLAQRLPGILPPLTADERLEAALIHSVAGLDERAIMAGVRPFRAPHHTASHAGLIGGGSPPRPGEASLAHHGVLFLDEMPEFAPATLQSLRQPMESGVVTIVRAEGRVTFPARFALIGAANPCPCGHLGDPTTPCTCTQASIERYHNRIGGPLIDRIDLICHVARPDPALLLTAHRGIASAVLRDKVLAARERALARGAPVAALDGDALLRWCRLEEASVGDLARIVRSRDVSARGVTRLLRVARTIADLEDSERVTTDHLLEALSYRCSTEV